ATAAANAQRRSEPTTAEGSAVTWSRAMRPMRKLFFAMCGLPSLPGRLRCRRYGSVLTVLSGSRSGEGREDAARADGGDCYAAAASSVQESPLADKEEAQRSLATWAGHD